MLEIFKAPVFEDNENTRKAYVFHKLIIGTIIITTIEIMLFWIASPENLLRWILSISVLDIPCMGLLYLNKKGYNKVASNVFIVLIFTLVTALAWTAGGVKAPVFHIIPVFVLFVGLLKGWRQGLLAGFFMAIMGLGFVFAELWHILPVSEVPYTSFNLWLAFFTSLALIALLQYHAVENLNKAFAKIQKELNLRTKAENELRKSETFRKHVFESSRIPIVVMEASTMKFIDCNQAAIEIYRYSSKEDILGKTPLDVSHLVQYDGTNSTEKAKIYIETAILEGQAVFEWKHQRPNGEIWDAEIHLMSFEAGNRKLLQFTLLDITERIRTKKELIESELRIKSISDNFKAGMIYQVVINKDGTRKFTYLSDSVKDLYGITPDEGMLNSNLIYNKVHPDDIQTLINTEEEAIKNLSVFKSEARVINPSGEIRWSSFVSTPKLSDDGLLCFDGIEFIITERKQAEEAYRISAAQLKANLDKTPNVAIQWYDDYGKILYWNPASEIMYGWSSEEALGKTLDMLIHTPEEAAGFLKILNNIKKTGQAYGPFESDITRRDGRKGWVLATTISFPMGNGKLGYACMDVDITERKLAEESLLESEEMFRVAFENAPTGMSILEPKGFTYLAVNPLLCEMFGYTKDEFLGKTVSLVTHPDDVKRSNEWIRKKFNGEPCDPDIEKRYIHKDGHIIWGMVRTEWIRNKDGSQRMSISHIQDITKRKKAENELKESEELFKSLIDLTPYGIALNDLQSRYLMVNRAFCDDWGLEPNEVVGKTNEEFGLLVDVELRNIMKNELLQKGFFKNIEGSIRSKQGNIIYSLYSGRIIQMNNQKVLMTSSVNITEKKIIEKELEKYRNHLEVLVKERTDELAATNEELNASNEELYEQREELQASLNKLNETQKRLIHSEKMASLGILSAGIAHEINNPLNFIHGGIYAIENYLKSNISEPIESLHPFIDAINEGVKRATDIVTSLNHYSRNDDLLKVDCNFHAIIDNCLIMLQNQLKNKVTIKKKYTDKAPLIFGNEGKLHQAILNIISNAEQAIDTSGNIEITTDIIDNQLIVIISDSGGGISAQNLQKVFDPFFTTKAPGKGTGLGLSITYNIIQEHRGTIEFESNLDQGTKVIIKLPINQN